MTDQSIKVRNDDGSAFAEISVAQFDRPALGEGVYVTGVIGPIGIVFTAHSARELSAALMAMAAQAEALDSLKGRAN